MHPAFFRKFALFAELDDRELAEFCESLLERRLELVHDAERQLAWFADVPKRALQSGLEAALAPR